MSFTYTTGIPATNNNPSDDQPDMLVNNDSVFNLINVDHQGFNLPHGGYHNSIHMNNQTSDPAATPGTFQLYSKLATYPADNMLFFRAGSGGIAQLTGGSALENGYVWCSGILFQWGKATTTGAVVLPIAYSTLFNVQLTGVIAGATSGTPVFYAFSIGPTGFSIGNNGSGSVTGYNIMWLAIGIV